MIQQRSTMLLNFALKRLPALLAAGLFLGLAVRAQNVEEFKLTVGKSIVLDYPSDIRQVSTSEPSVVDAMAVTTRELLLQGKGPGISTVVVWSRTGQRTIYSISVDQNLDSLRKLLKDTFPNEEIQVQSSKDSISLTGHVSAKDVADRAVALVTPFGKSIVNYLQLPAAPVERQILLRVKFAELDRNVSEAFAFNLISTGGNTVGSTTTGQAQPIIPSTLRSTLPGVPATALTYPISDVLNVFAFRPDLNLAAFLQALQQRGVLQILAEPNLVTSNGKEANFLVGGEFPVPVVQGGGNAGAVTVQFREFGIRLNFNPSITENNTIRMYVKPEVSTIDLANAVRLSGFLIPALSTRRMESTIELNPGQSFVIGGLIDDRVTESFSRVPGLSSIPLLGTLFKSKDEKKSRTELIVMVTPEIVKPLNPGDPGPVPAMPREFLKPLNPADLEKRSSMDSPQKTSKVTKTAAAIRAK